MITNPYTLFRRIANPTGHYPCGFLSQALRWQLDFSLFTFNFSLKHAHSGTM